MYPSLPLLAKNRLLTIHQMKMNSLFSKNSVIIECVNVVSLVYLNTLDLCCNHLNTLYQTKAIAPSIPYFRRFLPNS
jgi:hypothetical protein